MLQPINVILFASGGGSNIKAIEAYLDQYINLHFPLIVSNNPKAGILEWAEKANYVTKVIDKEILNSEEFKEEVKSYQPELIVLAGFLWKIPESWTQEWPNKIINIHPALLPAYGGKGMYGMNVHKAVKAAGEKESGMTIHYVNEHYDEGNIIMQGHCSIDENDSAEMIAAKVLKLEHHFYPRTIEWLLKDKLIKK